VLADPQTVTYATVAKVLPRISTNDSSSEYKLNDSGVVYDLIVSHQFAKRNRITARLKRDSFADDPLIEANNILASATVSFTVDFPSVGVTAVQAQDLSKALTGWLTDATLLKMINGET